MGKEKKYKSKKQLKKAGLITKKGDVKAKKPVTAEAIMEMPIIVGPSPIPTKLPQMREVPKNIKKAAKKRRAQQVEGMMDMPIMVGPSINVSQKSPAMFQRPNFNLPTRERFVKKATKATKVTPEDIDPRGPKGHTENDPYSND